MKEYKTNFSFMKNIEIYENSDAYRRICENARFAERSYFINSDIFNLYVRKAVELTCKFIEVSDRLKIKTNSDSSKKTIGTYLLQENQIEFIKAIGGISNYHLVSKIAAGVNPSVHDNYIVEKNPVESYEIIVALYELMVWLYRKYGGTQKILKTDFDERLIPNETDISFFFKEKDLNMDISERDKRYIESIKKREEEKINIVREGDKILVTDQNTGKKQYYLLEDYHDKEIANGKKIVERYKTKVDKLNDDLNKIKMENDEKEQLWKEEKKRILDEVAEIERNFEQISEEDKNTILSLKKQLEDEENKHFQITREYAEYFSQCQAQIDSLKDQCGSYKEQNGQLEAIIVAYERLKAEHSAIKYEMETQKKYIVIPNGLNEIILESKFQGTEKLRIYLLRLKAYYDEKERRYNEEIERISRERDDFRRKYEEKINEDNQIIYNRYQDKKRKKQWFWSRVASVCLIICMLLVTIIGVRTILDSPDAYKDDNAYVGNMIVEQTNKNMEGQINSESVSDAMNETLMSDFESGKDQNSEEDSSTNANSDKNLEDLFPQPIVIPQSIEDVVGINPKLLVEIEKLDIQSISIFGKNTKRDNMYYIGETAVPGMVKSGFSMNFMGLEGKDVLCNMTDNEIIKFTYMSGNGIGAVMIAVEISDLSDRLSKKSTIDDVKKILGDEVTYHEMQVATIFSDSEIQTAVLFEFEKRDGVIIMFDANGYICDYAYIGIQ